MKLAQLGLLLDTFHTNHLKDLFLEYNIAIPSSAAMERFFFLGKDILKRSGLLDDHFQIPRFLKGISEFRVKVLVYSFLRRRRLMWF